MTPDADPTSGIARDAFWLDGLLDVVRRDRPGDPTAACTAFVGLWICRSVAPSAQAVFRSAADRILTLLSGFEPRLLLSPMLSVTTHAILARSGLTEPSLDAFVAGRAEALAHASGADPTQDLELCEERVLLHQLGRGPAPPRVSLDEVPTRADVETLLLWTGSATAYGTAVPAPDGRAGDLAARLARRAVRLLRANDLRTAARLLRHACYLGLDDAERRRLAGLVALQQRPLGGYGFFADAHERLRELGGSGLRADVDLHLPVTLECLWARAEATTDWRLLRSVGRPDRP